MKILYGVQATGNGHISRARAINKYLQQDPNLSIDFLFSGRERDQFFDMQEFGDWACHKGLTFIHHAGKLKFFQTMKHNSMLQFRKDIKSLDLDKYDLILTDFEPITAWAAKLKKRQCIGIGHQYAFSYKVPRRGDAFIPKMIMKNFAPVSLGIGLHWHHFNEPIMPPIAEVYPTQDPEEKKKIVVYLGFEEPDHVIKLLSPFKEYDFYYYHTFKEEQQRGNIRLKPLSRDGFKYDLSTCSGVICNAGFELSSEAVQLGKKLLVKPLSGQLEQLSNARALEELGLGMTMDSLDQNVLRNWLTDFRGKQVIYPDVAKAIVDWISARRWEEENTLDKLAQELWSQVKADGVKSFTENPYPIAA